jgi:hypothetical protein
MYKKCSCHRVIHVNIRIGLKDNEISLAVFKPVETEMRLKFLSTGSTSLGKIKV